MHIYEKGKTKKFKKKKKKRKIFTLPTVTERIQKPSKVGREREARRQRWRQNWTSRWMRLSRSPRRLKRLLSSPNRSRQPKEHRKNKLELKSLPERPAKRPQVRRYKPGPPKRLQLQALRIRLSLQHPTLRRNPFLGKQ